MTLQVIPLRNAEIATGQFVKRALPGREKRTIGAWCFLDHFGPLKVDKNQIGIDISPHPHIGLQTFTWMLQGEIEHRDSLGSFNVIKPYEINLMNSGYGISHTEVSPKDFHGSLHTVQFWIALPENLMSMDPEFTHYANIPRIQYHNLDIHLLVGNYLGKTSPTKVYNPLMGADILATKESKTTLPLTESFEYGILIVAGKIEIGDQEYDENDFIVLEPKISEITLKFNLGSHIILIGGEPLNKPPILWWNFVAHNNADIRQALQDWNSGHKRFGDVEYSGARLAAPKLSERLKIDN